MSGVCCIFPLSEDQDTHSINIGGFDGHLYKFDRRMFQTPLEDHNLDATIWDCLETEPSQLVISSIYDGYGIYTKNKA